MTRCPGYTLRKKAVGEWGGIIDGTEIEVCLTEQKKKQQKT